MGKIFDALEKSNTQASKSVPLPHVRTENVSGKGADRIVPISNSSTLALEHKLDANLITYHAPQSVEAELFKVLRTNLLFPPKGQPPRKILVTSALPSDGKSFISSNLAISIALGIEEYVLLVDGDVRRPTIHSYFGFGKVTGLSEHLSMGIDLSKTLLKSPIPKLTILPAGHPPGNATELLTSKRMKTLLEEVANRYDDRYILIDSPPPSMAAETNAMINIVDGVILVVKAGVTPKNAVNETIEQIGKEKLLGVVLNYTDQSVKKYYGYGRSYYNG
jgi:exopolysaccharide/PEP-CTERM locus tyrosine autokinase